MTRPLLAIVLYAVVGASLTLFVYRIVLGGPIAPAGMERSIDGLLAFVVIAMNTVLVFAAAAVASVMAAQARWPFFAVMLLSAGVVSVVAAGMMVWFSGLGGAFPVVTALNGALCAFFAERLGLFEPPGRADGR